MEITQQRLARFETSESGVDFIFDPIQVAIAIGSQGQREADVVLAPLEHLTLVIMSYKRPMYLARSLRYWNNRGPRVIAFDGSPNPIDSSALEGLTSNLSYHHAPISYRARLELVESELRTPYVALLADDDFYLPSGLEASIRHLEENADYAACIGRPIGFGYELMSGVFGVTGVYGDMNNNYRIVSETPGLRMREHMGRYMPSTMYAVLRATNWKKTVEAYIKKEFPVFCIVELQMELATAYHGKSAVLPILSWLKSTELEQTVSAEISLQRVNEFHDFWRSDERFPSSFVRVMADVLRDIDQRPVQVVASEIRVAMDAYVAWCDSYFRNAISFFDAREFLKRVLPHALTSAITRYLRTMRLKRADNQKKTSLIAMGRQLTDTGTSVDMHELQEIIAFIHSFHDVQNPSDGDRKASDLSLSCAPSNSQIL